MRLRLPILELAIFVSVFVSLSSVSNANPRLINERFALSSVRLLYGAQMAYSANFGNDEFASELEVLRQAGLIDQALATGYKHFYTFTITAVPSSSTSRSYFTVSAVPSRYGKSGRMSFFVNLLGEIRGADRNGEPATGNDPIVGECSTGTLLDNQRCAIYVIRRLKTAQHRFFARNGRYGTATELVSSGEIDPGLGSLHSRGYTYTLYVNGASPPLVPASFRIYGFPFTYGQTGTMNYFLNTTGILHGTERQTPIVNETDPTIVVH